MSFIPWNKPRRTLSTHRVPLPGSMGEYESPLERIWHGWPSITGAVVPEQNWMPAIDVKDIDDAVVIIAEMPGFNESSIDITIEGNFLVLSGEKHDEFRTEKDHALHTERFFGSFRRTVELPPSVDPELIEANLDHGILTITAPKATEKFARQVQINRGESMIGTPGGTA